MVGYGCETSPERRLHVGAPTTAGCARLDQLVLVAVAAAPQQAVSVPLAMVPTQELADFECDGFLEHELSAQADRFGEGYPSGVGAQELFFEELAGELAFPGCCLPSV